MKAPSMPVPPSVPEDKPLPLTTFKNSLRAWQARYKARLATQAPDCEKADNQTAPS